MTPKVLSLINRVLTVGVILFLLFLIVGFLIEVTSLNSDTRTDQRADTRQSEIDTIIEMLETETGGQIASLLAVLPIVFVAGFSDAIGHSVVLFANRVRPNRFAVTILSNAALFIVGYLIWVGIVALISFTLFQQETAFIRAIFAVAGSYVPLIYSFLVALPYFGVLISNVIYFIAAIYLVDALQQFFPYTTVEAIACAFLSLIGVVGFRLTVGRPITRVRQKLLNAVAQTELYTNVNEAVAFVAKEGRQA